MAYFPQNFQTLNRVRKVPHELPTWSDTIGNAVEELEPNQVLTIEGTDKDGTSAVNQASSTNACGPITPLIGQKPTDVPHYNVGNPDGGTYKPPIFLGNRGTCERVYEGYVKTQRIQKGGGHQHLELEPFQQMVIEELYQGGHTSALHLLLRFRFFSPSSATNSGSRRVVLIVYMNFFNAVVYLLGL